MKMTGKNKSAREFILFIILGTPGLLTLLTWSLNSGVSKMHNYMSIFIPSLMVLILSIVAGLIFSKKVGLESPIITEFASSGKISCRLCNIIIVGIIGGILCCVISVLLGLVSFDSFSKINSEKAPNLLMTIFYGGINEEIIIHWSVMSFFLWLINLINNKDISNIVRANIAIGASALLFGIGHVPAIYMISKDIDAVYILYVVFGNFMFSLIPGYLFWKYGIESSIIAHSSANMLTYMLAKCL